MDTNQNMAPPTVSAPTSKPSSSGATTTQSNASSMKLPRENHHKENHQIALDILDDLSSRFIINVPVEERSDFIRICFQIELAHWFYLDFYCSAENTTLVPCGIKQFAYHIFHHIPFLKEHLHQLTDIMNDFKVYKMSVPTYGAILMTGDRQRVLLVQSFLAKSSWGFPKGKVNEDEEPLHCAIREVYEETGFDITALIRPDDFIEGVLNYQYTRLYIVPNVPADTAFAPRTRMEIKACTWFKLDLLPTHKMDPVCREKLGINANSFFMIMPFVKRLKRWVVEQRTGAGNINGNNGRSSKNTNGNGIGGNSGGQQLQQQQQQQRRQRHKSLGDLEGVKTTSGGNQNGGRQPQQQTGSGNASQTTQRTSVNQNQNTTTATSTTTTASTTVATSISNQTKQRTGTAASAASAALAVTVAADVTKQSDAKSANFKRQLFTLQQQQQQQQQQPVVVLAVATAFVPLVHPGAPPTQQHHSDPLAVAQRVSGLTAGDQPPNGSATATAATAAKKRRPIQSFLNGLNGDPAVQKWRQFSFVVRPELQTC